MMDFLQFFCSGLLNGLVYALLGLGLVLIFRASEAFNFAVGEFLVVGAFLFYFFYFNWGLPLLIALPLGLGAAGVFGGIVERSVIKPLMGRPHLSMTIITLGLSNILAGGLQATVGSNPYNFSVSLPDLTLDLGPLIFPSTNVWAGILSLAFFTMILLFLYKTRWGLVIQATSESQPKALCFGINAQSVLLLVWAIAAACIGASGIVISNLGALSSQISVVGLRAIPVVLIGGLDSIAGALVGGLIVGIAESLTGAYLEPAGLIGFKEVVPYFVLLIALFIRPYGLLGRVRIERV
ncbi:MAG: branched-chain amino acid ABC transporter permease [Deltaproteobacteria bacterium]|nr:branched-chain amino acid ABC transporter permease [Deltaproteobacteria bacterium]MBW2008926.1 branched-chain amino acid ABC transporter permease [Deltaproteobacteria bacterium]